jgi:hypothetical protein
VPDALENACTLMSEAISGHQRQSEAIRGHQHAWCPRIHACTLTAAFSHLLDVISTLATTWLLASGERSDAPDETDEAALASLKSARGDAPDETDEAALASLKSARGDAPDEAALASLKSARK